MFVSIVQKPHFLLSRRQIAKPCQHTFHWPPPGPHLRSRRSYRRRWKSWPSSSSRDLFTHGHENKYITQQLLFTELCFLNHFFFSTCHTNMRTNVEQNIQEQQCAWVSIGLSRFIFSKMNSTATQDWEYLMWLTLLKCITIYTMSH